MKYMQWNFLMCMKLVSRIIQPTCRKLNRKASVRCLAACCAARWTLLIFEFNGNEIPMTSSHSNKIYFSNVHFLRHFIDVHTNGYWVHACIWQVSQSMHGKCTLEMVNIIGRSIDTTEHAIIECDRFHDWTISITIFQSIIINKFAGCCIFAGNRNCNSTSFRSRLQCTKYGMESIEMCSVLSEHKRKTIYIHWLNVCS